MRPPPPFHLSFTPPPSTLTRLDLLVLSEHLTPLEKSVLALGEGLQHIQAEQEYMKMRERMHRNSEHPPHTPSRTVGRKDLAV